MATLRLIRIENSKKHDIPPKRLTIILDGTLLLKNIFKKTSINWLLTGN